MSAIPSRTQRSPLRQSKDVTALIPDFPFHYANYLKHPVLEKGPPCQIDPSHYGKRVLIVGAGVAGMVAAYEVMRMGLHPVVVEASDRIGGRLHSIPRGEAGNEVICELGAMRFPVSGKALFHYFEKVDMTKNSTDFPNPGSEAAVSSVVDYQGEQQYYEFESAEFPKPPEYEALETEFFENFLENFHFSALENAMTEGSIDQAEIKRLWNTIVNTDSGESWDDSSFYSALLQKSGWTREKIDLFGQIGFGTGGWNTDFPNSILEVLRVLYTALDVDHKLMFDGSSELPKNLWSRPPSDFLDKVIHWDLGITVESLSTGFLSEVFDSGDLLRKEVRHITRLEDGTFNVSITDTSNADTTKTLNFESIIYTPHVRILDKFRYSGSPAELEAMAGLFSRQVWEAISYTHYMQSAKIFAATTTPFWNNRDSSGKQKMSITLSDRLTRGTYLVDFSQSTGAYTGSGMYLSYTWNDDALKFLGDRSTDLPQHVELCTTLLDSIYPTINLNEQFSSANPFVEHNWEDQAFYLGAFKMNLPGQYELQRRLFSQFMNGVAENTPDGLVLAGDDISWTGGWAEGAVTSAINAVNKVAVRFGGGSFPDNPGPIESWNTLKPVQFKDPR